MSRGNVVYVNLPLVAGTRAQGGRRPAILINADAAAQGNPMRMIIPLTSSAAALRFPFTLQIQPSTVNGLSQPSIALVFQLCAADSTHIGATIGHLETKYITAIDAMVRQMLDV
jgi:mRNA interferase MazF